MTALINLRVPAVLKGRWIRASQAAGMQLTDWIILRMEQSVLASIRVPAGVTFSDLGLHYEPSGMSFDLSPLERVCEASGIDPDLLRNPEDGRITKLIIRWYGIHLATGGERDRAADALTAAVYAEDRRRSEQPIPPEQIPE
jgi:hypothetical protein